MQPSFYILLYNIQYTINITVYLTYKVNKYKNTRNSFKFKWNFSVSYLL